MTVWTCLIAGALAGPIPASTTELVLAEVPDVDATGAILTRWQRAGADAPWVQVGDPSPARIGASGVAWGRGLHPPQPGPQKVEGDDRSPEGVFLLGDAFGYAAEPPPGTRWPYHPVGPRDLWIEDPASPLYNTHLVVAGDRPLLDWEQAAVMRQGDPSHVLKVFVAHNAPPAAPGAGSAVFLHVWRGDGTHATAGCTSMPRDRLEALVAWLDPAATPVYVLLTAADLARLGPEWGLPAAPPPSVPSVVGHAAAR